VNTDTLIRTIRQRLHGNTLEEINKHTSGGLIDIDAFDSLISKVEISDQIQLLKEMQFLRITAYPGCNLRCFYCNPEGLASSNQQP